MPEMPGRVLMDHFQIGQRGVAIRAPVDHVRAAVDEPALIHAHEGFDDGAGKLGAERELLARPVATVADALHLVDDAAAVLFLPLPDALFELLAAELRLGDALRGEL